MKICDECETVAHCTKHGCIPKVSAKEAAMRLALEALETERDIYRENDAEDGAPEYIYEAITALREALAEQPAVQQQEHGIEVMQSKLSKKFFMRPIGGYELTVGDKLYTSPPAQRTWVGLTDEERKELWFRLGYMDLMIAIEAKLKEKNT